MNKTKSNQVFKQFIALCIIVSVFVIYFLMNRPIKLVVTAIDTESEILHFTFDQIEPNPPFSELLKRKDDGMHVILVLLTDKLKMLKNTSYTQLITEYEKCDEKFPCEVFQMEKAEFLKLAKPRKDK